ncbi:type I-E CRISPR-associated protein Cas5/CasD [Streptomyces melanogenes]|uniref:type I-E CRISPR-associated protein Cas5/CasD n=1 Tax=Streptomyces melanogenes TaxID=67326 RepID=UPI0037BCB863
MPTVLLRLSGPLQAYGVHPAFEAHQDTLPRPTKSAVIGLLCNALGYDLSADTRHLAALHFAVRADRPGHLERDDQTAGNGRFPLDALTASRHPQLAADPHRFTYAAPRETDAHGAASWKPETRKTVMGDQTYLADAAFLAGLTGPRELTDTLHQALARPARLLYLGRRCCPPAHPIAHGTTDHTTDWPDHVPLLPEATTPEPVCWQQTTDPTAPALPEHPPTSYQLRDHRTLAMSSRPTTPPPETETP